MPLVLFTAWNITALRSKFAAMSTSKFCNLILPRSNMLWGSVSSHEMELFPSIYPHCVWKALDSTSLMLSCSIIMLTWRL